MMARYRYYVEKCYEGSGTSRVWIGWGVIDSTTGKIATYGGLCDEIFRRKYAAEKQAEYLNNKEVSHDGQPSS